MAGAQRAERRARRLVVRRPPFREPRLLQGRQPARLFRPERLRRGGDASRLVGRHALCRERARRRVRAARQRGRRDDARDALSRRVRRSARDRQGALGRTRDRDGNGARAARCACGCASARRCSTSAPSSRSGRRRIRVDGVKALAASRDESAACRARGGATRGDSSAGRSSSACSTSRDASPDAAASVSRASSCSWRGRGRRAGTSCSTSRRRALRRRRAIHPAPQPRWKSNAERIVAVQGRVQAVSPALLSSVRMDGAGFVLRELQPLQDRMRMEAWGGDTRGPPRRHDDDGPRDRVGGAARPRGVRGRRRRTISSRSRSSGDGGVRSSRWRAESRLARGWSGATSARMSPRGD